MKCLYLQALLLGFLNCFGDLLTSLLLQFTFLDEVLVFGSFTNLLLMFSFVNVFSSSHRLARSLGDGDMSSMSGCGCRTDWNDSLVARKDGSRLVVHMNWVTMFGVQMLVDYDGIDSVMSGWVGCSGGRDGCGGYNSLATSMVAVNDNSRLAVAVFVDDDSWFAFGDGSGGCCSSWGVMDAMSVSIDYNSVFGVAMLVNDDGRFGGGAGFLGHGDFVVDHVAGGAIMVFVVMMILVMKLALLDLGLADFLLKFAF